MSEGAEDAEEDGGEHDANAQHARRRHSVVVEQAGDHDGQALVDTRECEDRCGES